MLGNADSKATMDSMPNENEKDCNKAPTRDQDSQTSRDQGTQTDLIFEFVEK